MIALCCTQFAFCLKRALGPKSFKKLLERTARRAKDGDFKLERNTLLMYRVTINEIYVLAV